MYTLFLSLAVAVVTVVIPLPFLGPQWTALPGLALGIFAFVWVNRRMAKRMEAVTQAADAELAGLQQLASRPGPNTQAAINHKFENAITLLKRGFAFERWQIGVGTMLNARIGILHFTRWIAFQQKEALEEAIPYLERSRVKGKKAKLLAALWPAWAMLAVCYYKGRKNVAGAKAVLEEAVGAAKKEGLLWGLYAWILAEEDLLDEAIAVLARGKDAVSDDEKLAENLTLLQNKKPMKMKTYGEQWYQFGLERPKMPNMVPQMGHPRMRQRGFRNR